MDQLTRHLNEIVNKTWNFAGKCVTDKDHTLNAVLGLAGEAGEVADLHKKVFYHSDKVQTDFREKLKHELGDVYFYLLKVQDIYGFTTEEILAANREKLESRHPELGKVTERFGKDAIK